MNFYFVCLCQKCIMALMHGCKLGAPSHSKSEFNPHEKTFCPVFIRRILSSKLFVGVRKLSISLLPQWGMSIVSTKISIIVVSTLFLKKQNNKSMKIESMIGPNTYGSLSILNFTIHFLCKYLVQCCFVY